MEPAFATSVRAAILAHQGGWDEALLIAGPILLIAVLLTVAKRRVDAAHRAAHAAQHVDDQHDDDQHDDDQHVERR